MNCKTLLALLCVFLPLCQSSAVAPITSIAALKFDWPVRNSFNRADLLQLYVHLRKTNIPIWVMTEIDVFDNASTIFKVSPSWLVSRPRPLSNDGSEFSIDRVLQLAVANKTGGNRLNAEGARDVSRLHQRLTQLQANSTENASTAVFMAKELLSAFPILAKETELAADRPLRDGDRLEIAKLNFINGVLKTLRRESPRTLANYIGWRLAERFSKEYEQKQQPPPHTVEQPTRSDLNWHYIIEAVLVVLLLGAMYDACARRRCCKRKSTRPQYEIQVSRPYNVSHY